MKNKTVDVQTSNLWVFLGTLKDFRRAQGKRHPLQIILLILILAVMSGAKSERAIARFAKNNKDELIRALKIKRKEIPGRTITQSVIQNIDFETLQTIFHTWAKGIVPLRKKEFASVDGKAIRGTVTDAQKSLQSFTSLVSVFASERRQVLAATKIHTKKESEIPAVRDLLKMLDLEGVTFTFDALHCQRKTLKTIVNSGNHYIVGVKDNQPKLHEELKKIAMIPSRHTKRRK